jgi:hydroxymethylpyrimidine/phosphomethylpyrimidine kinase
MVEAQIDAVAETGAVRAVKTGMLGAAPVIEAVAAALGRHDLGPLVVDPVQAAAKGGTLLDPEALPVLVASLFPRAHLITPNLPEAEALLGRPITSREAMAEAAAELATLGPAAVLLKGGHLTGDGSPDLLWSDGREVWLEGDRIGARLSHGTGCTLSAAIAAGLARGETLQPACRAAKAYVRSCLAALTRSF